MKTRSDLGAQPSIKDSNASCEWRKGYGAIRETRRAGCRSELGISPWEFSDALHRIKRAAGLRGADRVTIWQDGAVADSRGEVIGNIYDEV